MKRSYKILLGVASILPSIFTFLFVAFVIGIVVYTGAFGPRPLNAPTDKPLYPELGAPITVAFIVYFLTMMLSLGLKIYFIVHIIKNTSLQQNTKIIWMVVLFFAGMLAEPIYWYMNIWRDPVAAPVSEATTPLQPPDWR